MAFDHHAHGRASAAPGNDPRCWVSYGTVDDGTDDSPSVIFKDENGADLALGPLVRVTLQPSGIPVLCRVGGPLAGDGEAFYVPFVAGDEVLVNLPQGSERASPVIVARTNNPLDKWPTKVAGVDTTKNTLAFLRTRSPFALEVGPGLIIRSATTACMLQFGTDGSLMLANTDGHLLAMFADAVTLQTKNQEAMLQLDPAAGSTGIYGKSASFLISETDSKLASPGAVTFLTLGEKSAAHATTAEALAGVAYQVVKKIGAVIGGGAPPTTLPQVIAVIAAVTAELVTNLDATVAGIVTDAAGAALAGPVGGAVKSGLDAAKSAGGIGSEASPGLGCKGFLIG